MKDPHFDHRFHHTYAEALAEAERAIVRTAVVLLVGAGALVAVGWWLIA